MHRVLLVLSLSVLGLSGAAASTTLPGAVGLWQFPDREVWILVNPDGSTFQCRLARGGTLFKSKGTFVRLHSIQWQDIWDTDEVSLSDGSLTLSGKWGRFSYRKAADAMDAKCLESDDTH